MTQSVSSVGGDCVIFQGHIDKGGYGKHSSGRGAHRVAYEALHGPLPRDVQLDHLCRTRSCINPAHLEPVTARENTLRAEGFAAANAAKTHCVNGHEFTPETTAIRGTRAIRPGGTIWTGTRRVCLTCERARTRSYYYARKATA